ncbi:MAG: pyridoxal 5'-phosphate synthase glutaminase subunit PdxT [Thermoanaerobaculia bacterium]
MLVGVLALQGDFQAHGDALRRLGASVREVRTAEELRSVDGIALPGGESTTMRKLMEGTGLDEEIAAGVRAGKPIFATCAGVILLAQEISNPHGRGLGLLQAGVVRNAYGRQLDSTIVPLENVRSDLFGDRALEGVFIRAPRLVALGPDVEVLASRGVDPALVRQGNILAATFHPELSRDDRIHALFLSGLEAVPQRARDTQSTEENPGDEQATLVPGALERPERPTAPEARRTA